MLPSTDPLLVPRRVASTESVIDVTMNAMAAYVVARLSTVPGGTGAEGGLAAGAAKSRRDVRALSVLQQHNYDEEGTNQYVNDGDQNYHGCLSSRFGRRLEATHNFAHY